MTEKKALFDDEAKGWESLYRAAPGARWGLFQGYAAKRVRDRMELVLSLLPPVAGKRVFELGCGPGYYGMQLIGKGAQWTGLDLSGPMLDACRANTGSTRLVRANVVSLPFRASSCDILICIGVLSYLRRAEIDSLLSQIARTLRPGGMLVTQTIRLDPLTWVRCRLPRIVPRPVRVPGPTYPRNPRTIVRLIESKGLRVGRVIPFRKFLVCPAGTVYVARKA